MIIHLRHCCDMRQKGGALHKVGMRKLSRKKSWNHLFPIIIVAAAFSRTSSSVQFPFVTDRRQQSLGIFQG
jgi:hypothetical protein